MDELNIEFGLGELEVIEKLNNQSAFAFPVVHASKEILIFNSLAAKYLPAFVKWMVSADYIIGLPATDGDRNSFKIAAPRRNSFHCHIARFPTAMSKERGVKEGYYKLYKYKDGIAFKRYEPLDV